MPSESYATRYICFDPNQAMLEEELRALVADHGFSVANMSSHACMRRLIK
jgi:hypothetical protein